MPALRVLLALAVIFAPLRAAAAEPDLPRLDPKIIQAARYSDLELDARLVFLERELDGPELHAEIWWWGWLSFYSLGVVAQSTRLALVEGDTEGANAQRADFIISIAKAAAGVVSILLRPLSAQEGADPMRAVTGDTRADKLRRLAAGVETLEENAEEAERRYSWLRHGLLVAINLLGGAIVWLAFDDPTRGLTSAGIGIAVGQIVYWTQPWQAIGDLETYRSYDFSAGAVPE